MTYVERHEDFFYKYRKQNERKISRIIKSDFVAELKTRTILETEISVRKNFILVLSGVLKSSIYFKSEFL